MLSGLVAVHLLSHLLLVLESFQLSIISGFQSEKHLAILLLLLGYRVWEKREKRVTALATYRKRITIRTNKFSLTWLSSSSTESESVGLRKLVNLACHWILWSEIVTTNCDIITKLLWLDVRISWASVVVGWSLLLHKLIELCKHLLSVSTRLSSSVLVVVVLGVVVVVGRLICH